MHREFMLDINADWINDFADVFAMTDAAWIEQSRQQSEERFLNRIRETWAVTTLAHHAATPVEEALANRLKGDGSDCENWHATFLATPEHQAIQVAEREHARSCLEYMWFKRMDYAHDKLTFKRLRQMLLETAEDCAHEAAGLHLSGAEGPHLREGRKSGFNIGQERSMNLWECENILETLALCVREVRANPSKFQKDDTGAFSIYSFEALEAFEDEDGFMAPSVSLDFQITFNDSHAVTALREKILPLLETSTAARIRTIRRAARDTARPTHLPIKAGIKELSLFNTSAEQSIARINARRTDEKRGNESRRRWRMERAATVAAAKAIIANPSDSSAVLKRLGKMQCIFRGKA